MKSYILFSRANWDRTSASLKTRILVWTLLVWGPPVIAAIGARIFTGQVPEIGLFQDFAFHIRCLISVPILLVTEELTIKGVNEVIPIAIERGIIKSAQVSAVENIQSLILKLQKTFIPEIILLFLALFIVDKKIYIDLPTGLSTWRTIDNNWYHFAKWWNQWIGLTVYYFFITRWIYKFFLWCLFIYRFSLLKLNLQSLHPDEMGGIAFLVRRHAMFGLVATAISSVSSANIASSIIFGKLSLEHFYLPLGLYLGVMLLFLTLPLFILTPLLLRSKMRGRYEFDSTAYLYADFFESKWFIKRDSHKSEILGSPDIQSLNDLLESYSKLQSMRIIPINHRILVLLISFIVLPLLPLGLLKVPLTEMVSLIIKHFL